MDTQIQKQNKQKKDLTIQENGVTIDEKGRSAADTRSGSYKGFDISTLMILQQELLERAVLISKEIDRRKNKEMSGIMHRFKLIENQDAKNSLSAMMIKYPELGSISYSYVTSGPVHNIQYTSTVTYIGKSATGVPCRNKRASEVLACDTWVRNYAIDGYVSQYKKDLTQDGDIEANPGPVTNTNDLIIALDVLGGGAQVNTTVYTATQNIAYNSFAVDVFFLGTSMDNPRIGMQIVPFGGAPAPLLMIGQLSPQYFVHTTFPYNPLTFEVHAIDAERTCYFSLAPGDTVVVSNVALAVGEWYVSMRLRTIEMNPGPSLQEKMAMKKKISLNSGDEKLKEAITDLNDKLEAEATQDYEEEKGLGKRDNWTKEDQTRWFTVVLARYNKIKYIPCDLPAGQLSWSLGLYLGATSVVKKGGSHESNIAKATAPISDENTQEGQKEQSPMPKQQSEKPRGKKAAVVEETNRDNSMAAGTIGSNEAERASQGKYQQEKRERRRNWHEMQIQVIFTALKKHVDAKTVTPAIIWQGTVTLIRHRAGESRYNELLNLLNGLDFDPWVTAVCRAMYEGWNFKKLWQCQFAAVTEDSRGSRDLLGVFNKVVEAMNDCSWVEDLTVFGCVEKNPGPVFYPDQETALREAMHLDDLPNAEIKSRRINARDLWAETTFLSTGVNPNITDVNTQSALTIHTFDSVNNQVQRSFFPREQLFLPSAYNNGGVVVPRAVRSRWIALDELQVQGTPLIPTTSSIEMVNAAKLGMTNLFKADNTTLRGFLTNDLVQVAQQHSVRGICMMEPMTKLWLHFFGMAWADSFINTPQLGQWSNGHNTNTADTTVNPVVGFNVTQATPAFNESFGGATAIFPFLGGRNGTLFFHASFASVPAGAQAVLLPTGFIKAFTTSGAGNQGVGIAAFLLAIAPYPAVALHIAQNVLDNLANSLVIGAIPNSTTVSIPGLPDIHLVLPRGMVNRQPINALEANAIVMLQPSTGSQATTAFPVANTLLNVNFPGALPLVSYPLAEFILSWAGQINRGVIERCFSVLYMLGDFDKDAWASLELAIACIVRYPELVQTNPNYTPVAWARNLDAAANTQKLFTGFGTQVLQGNIPLNSAPPGEGFIPGLDFSAWNKVACGVAFDTSDVFEIKQIPFWLNESIPLALAMVECRLFAAAWQAGSMYHLIPESTMTTQIFANVQISTFRNVAEDFICPGDDSNLRAKGTLMGPFIESCLSLIHGDGVETDTAGLNVFNRWSSPLEQAGNVMNSATGIPAQGYSWGVLTDIWFNLTINVGIFAMSLPMNPLMTEGSRPVRKGSVDYRQMKPAITAAKYGPLLKTSEKWNYLNQGELYEFEDSELWNMRLMYMDFNLGCDTEDITEVVFIDRLPASTLPGDRQRTVVESGLTPAHAVCTIKLPIYNNVSGKLLIPTTVLATANSIVSGIIPPNVVMFITRHVPAQSAYIGPEKDNFMNKLAQKLKGGSSSSKEQNVGDLSKEPIIAISSTS